MDILSTDILKQFPVVALFVGLFIWFWNQMKQSRKDCDDRANERDKQFRDVLEQNTRAINELDRTIQNLQFRYIPENDRRRGDS